MLNQSFNKNEMIIANINVPGYLTINIQSIYVPRQDIIRVQEFINILPCDMNVKIKLMQDDTNLMHYINSNFQNEVIYSETHVIYNINQYISLPIKISQLDVSHKLKIKLCQQNKPIASFYFNLFCEQFQLDYFQNGKQTHQLDNGIKLNFEILPQAQQDIVYYVENHCQTHYKTRYKNNPREIDLQLSDFEQIINTGQVSDKQLAEMVDLYRQNITSNILNYHTIMEPVNAMKQSQLYEGDKQYLQMYDIHIKSNHEPKSPLELFNQNIDGSVILDQIIEEIDKDGQIAFDETKQVNILPVEDFIKIQEDLQNIQDNNFEKNHQTFHIPKNTLDKCFQYEMVTTKLYQSDQRYQNNASLINDLSLNNNTHNIPSQYQVMKIKEILKMSYLQDLSVSEAKILLQYKYYIKEKVINSIYRLSEAFCICQINDEDALQSFFDNKFNGVQMHEILMLFDLSESQRIQFFRKLAISYLNQQSVSTIQKYIFQLTLQLQLDSQDNELEQFMTKLVSKKQNLYRFAQYYHYLNAWKMQADEESSVVSEKYQRCMKEYLQAIEPFGKFRNHLLRSIELQSEMFRLVNIVKTLSNDRQEQLLLLRQELKKRDKYKVLLGDDPVMFPFIMQNGFPVWVQGLYSEECHVFKSAKKPFLVHLKQVNSESVINQLIDLTNVHDNEEIKVSQENKSKVQYLPTKSTEDSQQSSYDGSNNAKMVEDTTDDHNIGNLDTKKQDFTDLQLLLKFNDDVRQDAVILQQFEIIDQLLRHQHQELCYTQFTAFPFSQRFGMIQIVHPCICIDAIITDKRFVTIQAFLKNCRSISNQNSETRHNSITLDIIKSVIDGPSQNVDIHKSVNDQSQNQQSLNSININSSVKSVMQYSLTDSVKSDVQRQDQDCWSCHLSQSEQTERLCRSMAIYTVLTYALGVGDRHLENILIQPDGRLLHVDFGWAFGREPRGRGGSKLKVSPEMVEALGGMEAPAFKRFVALACGAWTILRDNSNALVAGLLTAAKALPVLQQPQGLSWLGGRLRPELDSEQAALHFLQVLIQQVSTGAGNFMDQIHRWVQVTRK